MWSFNRIFSLTGIVAVFLFAGFTKLEAGQGARVWHAYYEVKHCPYSNSLHPGQNCREYHWSSNWGAGRQYITNHQRTYNEAKQAAIYQGKRDQYNCGTYCWRRKNHNNNKNYYRDLYRKRAAENKKRQQYHNNSGNLNFLGESWHRH